MGRRPTHEIDPENISQLFANNVVICAKMNGLKLYTVETAAGYQTGYLSRVRSGLLNSITLAGAAKFAEIVGESLDDLVTKDYSLQALEQEVMELEKALEEKRKELSERTNSGGDGDG